MRSFAEKNESKKKANHEICPFGLDLTIIHRYRRNHLQEN